MLVLRTSNFQGAAIRPIVPRHCPYCSAPNFLLRASSKSIRLQLNYFQDFEAKTVKAKYKIRKRKQTKTLKGERKAITQFFKSRSYEST